MNQTQNNLAVYNAAKKCLGVHITLDPTVPPDVGCAEAVSFVLKKAGVQNIPPKGFAGTADLYHFLSDFQPQFWFKSDSPLPGDVIISPTGSPNTAFLHGHVGILGLHGILSNNSDTGLFDEHITLAAWNDFYKVRGGFPVYFFRRI